MNDPRIGKQEERKPSVTISGHGFDVAWQTVGLGDGYYCVVDVYPSVDVDEVILELKGNVDGLTKPANKRSNRKRSNNSDVPASDAEAG